MIKQILTIPKLSASYTKLSNFAPRNKSYINLFIDQLSWCAMVD